MARRPSRADLDHVLDHTAGLWDDLRGERVLVTGGTGFFGTWLLESFVAAGERFGLGAQAVVLTRGPDAFRDHVPHLASHPSIAVWPGDVRTFDPPPGTFAFVIHAATTSSPAVDAEVQADTIAGGTRHVLEVAGRARARRLLFTSSGAVYGRNPPGTTHVSEDHAGGPDPLAARSVYGEAKRFAEMLVSARARATGLEAVMARGFAFVGPHLPLDGHFAIGNFIRDGLAGGPIVVQGDGTPRRSYLYAADLAIWLWTLLLRGRSGRAYNVGSEEDLAVGDLARRIAAYFGTKARITKMPAPGREPERYVPATARARSELGLEAWVPLDEAIRRTARWHRGQE
jgi:dTDP-glucose 4,6-dehydratase